MDLKEVLYIDLGENKVDEVERFIVHIEDGKEIYRVFASVYPDGGIVLAEKTPDSHMADVVGELRSIALKYAMKACCKIGVFVDPIQTKIRMSE